MGFQFTHAVWPLLVVLGFGQVPSTQESSKGAFIAIRVTGPSGIAFEGAEVRFVKVGFVEQASRDEVKRTDKMGEALAELKPGDYEVKVSSQGFKSVLIHYLQATAAEHKQFDVSLEELPPSDCCVDPVDPVIEPEHVEPRNNRLMEPFQLQRISDGILCTPQHLNCKDRNIRWESFTLQAADGHLLDFVSIPFPTYKRAMKEFQEHLRAAQNILRREPEPNRTGNIVGERALGWFAAMSEARARRAAYYSIFWTWDNNYWALTGDHLEDVLALERRLKEEGTNAVWRWH